MSEQNDESYIKIFYSDEVYIDWDKKEGQLNIGFGHLNNRNARIWIAFSSEETKEIIKALNKIPFGRDVK